MKVAWLVRVGLLAILALATGACGVGSEPLPEESGSLAPDRYSTEEFETALSFEVGEEWAIAGPEEQGSFAIAWRDSQAGRDPTIFFFDAPPEVYSPKNPEEIGPVPAPEDWVAWYRHHPYLQADEPRAVSVGGVEGRQIVVGVDLLPGGKEVDSVWCGGIAF